MLQNKEKQIQDLLKNEMGLFVAVAECQMGLLVCNVKASCSRMSNDWNTARRFFKKLLRICYNYRCQQISYSQVLCNSAEYLIRIFNEHWRIQPETLLIKEYQWFYLPASIHKIEPILDLGLFCLLGNCPKKPGNLEIGIEGTSEESFEKYISVINKWKRF
jgi:hypothetical protein